MKSKTTQILIIILLFTILFFIYSTCYNKSEYLTNVNNISWSRNKCSYDMNYTLENVLKKHNIKRDDKNWSVFFPCAYDETDIEINNMPSPDVKENPDSENKKYYIINGSDHISAKEWLWMNVVDHQGLEKAQLMMPNTFVLNRDADIKRFNETYMNSYGKVFIMKKNIQRQEGLKITNSKEEALAGKNNGFVLVQELLQNPYIIDGRKTNMRFYVLVVCNKSKVSVYVYNDGFMYYTRKPFEKNSTDTDVNITTGYIDRAVYDKNPLTHQDLRKYLDSVRPKTQIEQYVEFQGFKISDIVFDRIIELLKNIFSSFLGKICKCKKFMKCTSFQLFGPDIAVSDNLQPTIMEINKGPDMDAKDKRDSDLKHAVTTDLLQIVDIIPKQSTNGFIKIIDFDNNVIV